MTLRSFVPLTMTSDATSGVDGTASEGFMKSFLKSALFFIRCLESSGRLKKEGKDE